MQALRAAPKAGVRRQEPGSRKQQIGCGEWKACVRQMGTDFLAFAALHTLKWPCLLRGPLPVCVRFLSLPIDPSLEGFYDEAFCFAEFFCFFFAARVHAR